MAFHLRMTEEAYTAHRARRARECAAIDSPIPRESGPQYAEGVPGGELQGNLREVAQVQPAGPNEEEGRSEQSGVAACTKAPAGDESPSSAGQHDQLQSGAAVARQAHNLKVGGSNPPSATIPERDVLAAVLSYLATQPRRVTWFSRMNVGGMHNEAGQFVRFGFPGCSDIIGQMADGRFLAIECKRRGKLPTLDQWEFLSKVTRGNGVAIVATSIDDVRRVIER